MKGQESQSHPASKPFMTEGVWTKNKCDLYNSAVFSNGNPSFGSRGTGNLSHGFINHGFLLWTQIRLQWVGNKRTSKQEDQHREPRLSMAAPRRPEDLVPVAQRSEIIVNNHQFDADVLDMPAAHRIIKEILRHHFVYDCLNLTASVPAIYLQEYWHTIFIDYTEDSELIVGSIEGHEYSISLQRFRRLLHLPAYEEYDPLPSNRQLCEDIAALGYNNILRTPSQFKRMYLAQRWVCLFTIINRCTTSKTLGIDQAHLQTLQFFHGIVYNRDYDYSSLIWSEMLSVISSKLTQRRRRFIPFMRYFSLIIQRIMIRHPCIPRRMNEPHQDIPIMRVIKSTCGHPAIDAMVVPGDLLNLVAADNEAWIAYEGGANLEQVPMESPEPETPSPGTSPLGSSEGTRTDLGEGDGAANTAEMEDIEETDLDTTTPEIQRVPGLSPLVDEAAAEIISDSEDPNDNVDGNDGGDDDLDDNADGNNGGGDDLGGDDDLGMDIFEEVRTPSPNFDTNQFLSTPPTRVDEPTIISRATLNSTLCHVLTTSVQVVSCPLTQAQPPLSHSAAISETTVSLPSGDFTHTLPVSHLGTTGIETRVSLPPYTPSLDHASLDPFEDIILPRTQVSHVSLGDLTGTSIVTPSTGLQGLEGNPTRAIPVPTLNVGSTVTSFVDATSVSTGNLSDPGVIFISNFVSRQFLEEALRKQREEIFAHIEVQLRTSSSNNASTSRSPASAAPVDFAETLKGMSDSLNAMSNVLTSMDARLSEIEKSCKPPARGEKRPHDDQDPDLNQREGEMGKRQRIEVEGSGAQRVEEVVGDVAGSQEAGTSSQHQQSSQNLELVTWMDRGKAEMVNFDSEEELPEIFRRKHLVNAGLVSESESDRDEDAVAAYYEDLQSLGLPQK